MRRRLKVEAVAHAYSIMILETTIFNHGLWHCGGLFWRIRNNFIVRDKTLNPVNAILMQPRTWEDSNSKNQPPMLRFWMKENDDEVCVSKCSLYRS